MRATLTRVLGSRPLREASFALSRPSLRILAYHGITDEASFERQLMHLTERYRCVTGREVTAALTGGHDLPPEAVWLTFDDGFPEVAGLGRRMLARFGLTATMFVCPSVIDTQEPYWWEVVREAHRLGINGSAKPSAISELELNDMSDHHRRRIVAELSSAIEERSGLPFRRDQLTTEQLRRWVADGHEVGNHSWDHPLLNRCSASEQRQQVRSAHGWLRDAVAPTHAFFAYPSGHWAAEAEEELVSLGYDLALGFDHQVTRLPAHPLRLSRLRVASHHPLSRFQAVVAGGHSLVLSAWARVQRGRSADEDPRQFP